MHLSLLIDPSPFQISSDQFSEFDTNMFFQRVVFDFSECIVGTGNTGKRGKEYFHLHTFIWNQNPFCLDTAVLERALAELARRYDMK